MVNSRDTNATNNFKTHDKPGDGLNSIWNRELQNPRPCSPSDLALKFFGRKLAGKSAEYAVSARNSGS